MFMVTSVQAIEVKTLTLKMDIKHILCFFPAADQRKPKGRQAKPNAGVRSLGPVEAPPHQ
jgi:hypothetical protein